MAKLQRIHSMTKRSIAMRDSDVDAVVRELEAIIADESFARVPALRACVMRDGWIPIASVLNYSPLGRIVWPFGGVGVVSDSVTARGSMAVELSGDLVCVRKKPLRVQLREQLEYIYSDANYPKDVHLQLLEDKEGFAKLDLVCSTYTQTVQLLQPIASARARTALLHEALKSSSELVLRPPPTPAAGSGMVRRMTLPERICSQVEFYLDPARMAADRFLIEQSRDHGGFVPIATILSFPRMRKLCHPQVAAVAHVLSSKSTKLEVSEDKQLVRPRLRPPESPARASVPANTRAQVTTAVERLMNDANIIFDKHLQSAILSHSPSDALCSGGTGVRIPVDEVFSHPVIEAILRTSGTSLLAAIKSFAANREDPASAAAWVLLRKQIAELLPRRGESEVVQLSDDGKFLERLQPTPEVRQMVAAAPAQGTPIASHGEASFSAMTFNLLADMLCTCEQFPEVSVDVLDWEYRHELLEKEIVFHMPDILCLQELQGTATGEGDGDHHRQLADALTVHGYDHRYIRKVKCDGTSWPHLQIGNAIFWNVTAFEYVEHEEVLIAPMLAAASHNDQSQAHFSRGAQVGLIVTLRHQESGRNVIAVTTHLSCNFLEPCTQIAQVHAVLTTAARLLDRIGRKTPVVFAGDLNSMPGSGVYELVTSGLLSPAHPHMHVAGEGVQMPSFGEFGGGGNALVHNLRLRSAYVSVQGHEPLFTNFTGPPSNFVGTLDYIAFSPSTLKCTHVLALPSEDTVRKEKCLPSSRFPSDHLPLLAQFTLLEEIDPSSHKPTICVPNEPVAMAGVAPESAVEAEDMIISPKRQREGETIEVPMPLRVAADGGVAVAPTNGRKARTSSPGLDPNAVPFVSSGLGAEIPSSSHAQVPEAAVGAGSLRDTPPRHGASHRRRTGKGPGSGKTRPRSS